MAFVGGSSFATDFQQVIDRAIAIAALPLVQLQSQRALLEDQTAALAVIDEQFANLQTAIESLNTENGLHSATVADESIARVTLGDNVLAADYALEVVSLGSRTLTQSLDGLATVTDPFTESVSSSTDFTLTVDGNDYAVTPASESLFDLASAINASGAEVQATVVNIGGSSGPDYRLSLQSKKYADVSIQLNDGSQDILQTLVAGAAVTYTVNGVPAGGISTDTRSVTLSPGVTVDLLNIGVTEIAVSQNVDSIGDALASFVTAYNAAVDGLDFHRGTADGVLNGQAILSTLARSLGDVSGYTAAEGDIRSLADLGISLDQQGRLSLDRNVLESKPADGVLAFLGNSTTPGFLQAAEDAINSLRDPVDGLIELEKASLDRRIESQDRQIAANEDRIALMEENLTARIAAADAVIAALEQQVLTITGLFESLRAAKESLK